MQSRMQAHRRTLAGLTLLTTLVIVCLAGCESDSRHGPVSLAPADQPLYPPTRLVRTPDGDLVALVSEQDPALSDLAGLALYRAAAPGASWSRWTALPLAPGYADVDFAAGAQRLVIAASYGESLQVVSLPLDATSPASVIEVVALPADSTVLGLALGASLGVGDTAPAHHLLALAEAEADSGRVLHYRRSQDGGLSWGPPVLLAHGALGYPGIFARSERADVVDVVYMRDELLRWRGNTHGGRRWNAEKELRLRVGAHSRNGVARIGHLVLATGESSRHQVVCSTSRNGGHNWERATAIARDTAAPRDPAVDSGFGRFWVAFTEGDSVLVARSTVSPWHPKQWSERIPVAAGPFTGRPAIAALPDSTAGILYATPTGRVHFAIARLGAVPS